MIEDGRPNPDDKDDIIDRLIENAEESFGEELDPETAIILRSFYDPVAEEFELQQDSLAELINSLQVDYAEGEALDIRGQLIGVLREFAQPATGQAQFGRDGPTTRNYTIPEGTEIQTDSSEAVVYRTTRSRTLSLVDDFESGDTSEYGGDLSSFTVQQTTVYEGDYSLESTASGTIIDNDEFDNEGSKFHARLLLNSGAGGGIVMGANDIENYYGVRVDQSAGELAVIARDSDVVSVIDSTSVTVPANEWLEVVTEWRADGNFRVELYNAAGSEIATLTATDTQNLYTDGVAGFFDSNGGGVYYDNYAESVVGISIEAVEDGEETNVGSNRLTVLKDDVVGIQSVTNWLPATGGRNRERDDVYRERLKTELNDGMAASKPALISALRDVDETRSVSVIENDNDTTDADGRPLNSFEAIVDAPTTSFDAVAETIMETKAAGSPSVGGYAGDAITRTVTLDNGQEDQITFSQPTAVQIYIDCSIEVEAEYTSDEEVQDNIVSYIGGTVNDGGELQGELGVADDVLYNQIIEQVMTVDGVRDITNLEVDTVSDPTGQSNISIADNESAYADATDGTINITSSEV